MAAPELTVSDFKLRFPFFSETDGGTIQMAIDEAVDTFPGCTEFPQYLGIIGNHAAHLLASEPAGHSLRINKTTPDTTYSVNRDNLLRKVPGSPLVIC